MSFLSWAMGLASLLEVAELVQWAYLFSLA
jgi:hypothetical protein